MADPVAPQVSVVIPTYNRPALLQRAIASVNAQSYKNIELIVVDDGSDIPVRRSLESLPLDSIESLKFLRQEPNRGANVARNQGIKAASGEFIAFLDDDDWWEREKLERQIKCFNTGSKDLGVVYTGTRYLDIDRDRTIESSPDLRGNITKRLLSGEQLEEFSTVMVRATVLEDAGLPDERLPSWQDLEWYLRLSQHCEFEVIQEPLTIRQLNHGDQIRKNYREKRDVSYPLILEKHRSLAAEYGQKYERRFVGHLSRLLGLSAFSNGYYREAIGHLLRGILHDPFHWISYPYLVVALGGKPTHEFAIWLRDRVGRAFQ